MDEVNRTGGIKSMGGAKLEFVYADCESVPKKMVTEMEKMLTLRKPHVIATAGSSALTKPALPVIDRYKVPLVSREYSDELLTMKSRFFFMPMPKITVNAKAMADAFIKIGKEKNHPVKSVAILCQDGSFGEMASDVLGKHFPSQGVNVVANQIYPTGKVSDYTTEIIADEMQLLGSREGGGGGGGGDVEFGSAAPDARGSGGGGAPPAAKGGGAKKPNADDLDDDIPF